MIVITGATGHIGNVLTTALVERGEEVRALVQPSDDLWPLRGLPVEVVLGDIGNVPFLTQTFTGAEVVYHLAEQFTTGSGPRPGHNNENEKENSRRALLHQINVVGTENVLEACRKAWVSRLVYKSSIHAIAQPPDRVVDETFAVDPRQATGDYGRSKAEATLKVLSAAEQGLNAVVVYPTAVIGPYDYTPSPIGKMLIDLTLGRVQVTATDAYDFVDVRDVAEGIILAGAKGQRGEGYLLSGERVTITELANDLRQFMRAKPGRATVSSLLAQAETYLTLSYYRLTRGSARYSGGYLKTLLGDYTVSNEKARRELGFTSRPIKQSVVDTMEWFRSNRTI